MVSINTDISPSLPAVEAAPAPGASIPEARPGFRDHLAQARRQPPEPAAANPTSAAPAANPRPDTARPPESESHADSPPADEKTSAAAADVEPQANQTLAPFVRPDAALAAPPMVACAVARTEPSLPDPSEAAGKQLPAGRAEESGQLPSAPPAAGDRGAKPAVDLAAVEQLAADSSPPIHAPGGVSENRAPAAPQAVPAQTPAAPPASSAAPNTVAPPLREQPKPEKHQHDGAPPAAEQMAPLPAQPADVPPGAAPPAAGGSADAEPPSTGGHRGPNAVEEIKPLSQDARPAAPSAAPADPAAAPAPRLPVSLAAHGGAGGDPPSGLSEVQRVRFVQRVARAFQAVGEHGNPLRLRLSPPELGSLRLEISISQGQMSARVEAETPAARALLLDSLPALRERLEQQDIKIARFDVDLFDPPRDGLPQNQQRGLAGEEFLPPGGLRRKTAPADSTPAPVAAAAGMTRDGRLNVVI